MAQYAVKAKDKSDYPLFDELAFSMLNDLMFFSGTTKLIYFHAVGMPTDKAIWGALRTRVARCEGKLYSIELARQKVKLYEVLLQELQSIFRDCLATASALESKGTPWGIEREALFREKMIAMEVLVLMLPYNVDAP